MQSIPGIQITTSVDKAEVFIGDLITYEVTIEHDSAITLIPPPLGANLGAFDVKDYDPDKEKKLEGGRVQTTTTFVLSTFTTGDYVIPAIPILFELPDKTRKVMLAEPVPIKIKSMLENAGDSVDIRPVKDPYEFKRNWVPYYLLGGSLMILLIAFALWWKLRKRPEAGAYVDLRPPWEIAYEKLALLQSSPTLADEKYKDYYVALTEIIRDFLGRVYRITVLDMTTEEFLVIFKGMDLPEGLYGQTSDLLQHADLVKFAKYVPERSRAEQDFEAAHTIVNLVRIEEERRQQTQMHLASNTTPTSTDTGGRK
ncbi:MAG: hypothetical protein IPH75_06320 [bacterium]|nr:hypothetical protein [bacterium]